MTSISATSLIHQLNGSISFLDPHLLHSSPYSRKPWFLGDNMSINAKSVSRGVHNIVFSLLHDQFWSFDLEKITLKKPPIHAKRVINTVRMVIPP